MLILENVDLKPFNTFALSARARYFCEIESVTALSTALQFSRQRSLPILVLGGGSNVLLREDFPGLVIHILLRGIEVLETRASEVLVSAAGGENWHGFVETCLHNHWYGLENLALIPGTVGAAPIQNIGAYGIEIKDFISDLSVLDIVSGTVKIIPAAECRFGYRDSVFKHELKGTCIILSVNFRLFRQPRVDLSYAALAQAMQGISATPAPADVFAAVCAVRRSKLPDPSVHGNAGSFFKNPVISPLVLQRIRQQYPDIPSFPVGQEADGSVKVPAAWLIDKAGWKGRTVGSAAVYQYQPLVLVNLGGATSDEIIELAQAIMRDIAQRFGIHLESEVQWIPPLSPEAKELF